MRAQWRIHKVIWNLSGGRLGRRVVGMPVLELVTIGHRSGRERQILITYVDDSAGPLIIGTNAGRDADPAWVKNLRSNPRARARWGGRWRDVLAIELSGGDRESAWRRAVAANSGYADSAVGMNRHIPIMQLEQA